jgi:microcystin-dependent protein
MAFIIPNARYTDSGSGGKFVTLNQAEPDSLDFEILGNNGRSGVVSGLVVTVDGSNLRYTSGAVVVNGTPYNVAAGSVPVPTAPASGTVRFDLVIARLSGSTVTIQTLSGTEEATNVEFPLSVNVASVPTSSHVDLGTDVVLATVYRTAGGAVTNADIADRRTLLSSSVVHQGTADPSPSFGGTGTLYYKSTVGSGTSSSGLYIKNASGAWTNIAQDFGPQIPVGSVIPWMGSGAVPTGWLECNGSSFSASEYPDLFAVLGSTTLPNLVEQHLRGGTSANVRTAVANTANTVTLSEANLPSHTHDLSNHTHGMDHRHSVTHNHASTNSTYDSGHTHSLSGNTQDAGHAHQHYPDLGASLNNRYFAMRLTSNPDGSLPKQDGYFFSIPGYLSSIPSGDNGAFMLIGYTLLTDNGTTFGSVHKHGLSGSTGGASYSSGIHRHAVDLDEVTVTSGTAIATTSSSSRSSTDGPSSNSTSGVGSGTSFSIRPPALYTRWIIRATGLVTTPSPSSYDEALEEVVTIELSENGANLANGVAAYYRMPWGATLTNVRAALNSGNVTTATTVSISGSSAGTITADLVIDAGESSSTTATAPTITATSMADDELLTFTVSGATTTDVGPLIVTLYFNRVA